METAKASRFERFAVLRKSTQTSYVPFMFSAIRLRESFQYVMSESEWRWFGPMDERRSLHVDERGWPLYSHAELRKFYKLRAEAVSRVSEKLRDGEWTAKGICLHYGTEHRVIEPDLWTYLNLDDRMDEAYGLGKRFLVLTVSSLEPPRSPISHSEKAQLRASLTTWLRARDDKATGSELIADQLAAARAAFAPAEITPSMNRDCRRAANLKPGSIQRGRPPKKA